MKKTHYFGSLVHCHKTKPGEVERVRLKLRSMVEGDAGKPLIFLRENRRIDLASSPIVAQSALKIDLSKEPQAPRSGEDKPHLEYKKPQILKLGRSFTLGNERPRAKTEAIRRKPQNGPSLF